MKTFKLEAMEGTTVLPEPRRGGGAEVIVLRRPEHGRIVATEYQGDHQGFDDLGSDGDRSVESVMNKLSTDQNYQLLSNRLRKFSHTTDARMESLREALASGDATSVAALAHVLTDDTGRIGAVRMMRLCIAMQMLGRRGMIDKARELMIELEGEYEEVKDGHQAALA